MCILEFVKKAMGSITKTRKNNYDEVNERICLCITNDDADPFWGEVKTMADLKTHFQVARDANNQLSTQEIVTGLVSGVKEGWFNVLKAERLVQEMARLFSSD
jgi:hypothetical protein